MGRGGGGGNRAGLRGWGLGTGPGPGAARIGPVGRLGSGWRGSDWGNRMGTA